MEKQQSPPAWWAAAREEVERHFAMHEDISETFRHLLYEHHAQPAMPERSLGEGPAEVLAVQHMNLHSGIIPTFGKMVVADPVSLAQHMLQDHVVRSAVGLLENSHLAHIRAHLHGDSAPGREHNHERPLWSRKRP